MAAKTIVKTIDATVAYSMQVAHRLANIQSGWIK